MGMTVKKKNEIFAWLWKQPCGSGITYTIPNTVDFVGCVSAARPFRRMRRLESACIHSKQCPGSITSNICVSGVLVKLVSLQKAVGEWWSTAIGKAAIVCDECSRHSSGRSGTFPALSSWYWELLATCLMYQLFYSLIYIPFKNRVSLWCWAGRCRHSICTCVLTM